MKIRASKVEGHEIHTAVDLCCGSGAVTAGLRKRGFDVIAAVDNDPVACETYRANHPRVKLLQEDLRSIDPHMLLDARSVSEYSKSACHNHNYW
ncbi:MAG: DNA cytosine methyltransferase [Bryobacteraceae bacterium]